MLIACLWPSKDSDVVYHVSLVKSKVVTCVILITLVYFCVLFALLIVFSFLIPYQEETVSRSITCQVELSETIMITTNLPLSQ